ncbi:uncharacterized protein LOC142527981 isoform X3 [Primulina tabacum]|uniref:uncharacterized protein LOC142527981 isoform X3 n=1 Tax=Primulina tabacum TaxID=48773 RepID=UPI003F5A8D36
MSFLCFSVVQSLRRFEVSTEILAPVCRIYKISIYYGQKSFFLIFEETRRRPQSRGKSGSKRDCIATNLGERTKLKTRHDYGV